MDIEQSKERCKELTKEAHAGWIGISNQIAIKTVLNTMYKSIEESAYYRDLVKLERKEKEQLKKSLKGQIKKKDEEIESLKKRVPSMANGTYTGDCEGLLKLEQEIIKRDKVINKMSTYVNSPFRIPEEKYCEFYNSDEDCCWKTDKECKDCIKEYFTNKAENVEE